MGLAKVRLVVFLVIVVAVVTFVLVGTKRKEIVSFSAFGSLRTISPKVVILLSLSVGFVLGQLFRITRFFRKKVPKKTGQ